LPAIGTFARRGKQMAALGLRGKSLLALLFACLFALVPAALVSWQVLDGIHQRFAQAYARNATLLNREKIFAPVSRELALALRLADSEVTRQWLRDEQDVQKRELFFREAEGYRTAFHDHAYFVGSEASQAYYFNDGALPFSTAPRFVMQAHTARDNWYFATRAGDAAYNLNVDQSLGSHDIKIWLNVLVREDGRTLGVTGSGINLSTFLDDFIAQKEQGVSTLIIDEQGALQVYSDNRRLAINSGALHAVAQTRNSLFGLLDDAQDPARVRQAMAEAVDAPGSVSTSWVTLNDKRQLLAFSYIPELKWHVVTAIDLSVVPVLDSNWLTRALIALAILLLALVVGFSLAVERLMLRPLRQLQHSAKAVAAGQYDVPLPAAAGDEIGELSTTFGVMAHKVRRHTQELERRVSERTQALEQANDEMVTARKKIDDSINYASLIQHIILPDRQLAGAVGLQHAVLWRPRDVVGGDFYLYRASAAGCLFGVVDCAGHGVPGALMTMLAHAAIDQAISAGDLSDPASILQHSDRIIRGMLPDGSAQQGLATNMDVGLAYVDFASRQLTFAGAKIGLYFSDGPTLEELPAGRRAIGGRRLGIYANSRVAAPAGRTFYLSTDGFIDQAGGELGYGFGSRRFATMILAHAQQPLAEQCAAFSATLAAYQGEYAQRDDITLLCVQFD
jgi:serine phosphatase RsbU (regulator of sigma subunit)